MAALVIEMNLDETLICEPMGPFFATSTAHPSRVHILLFPVSMAGGECWLAEHSEDRGKRSICELESVFSSILYFFAVVFWTDHFQMFPRPLNGGLPAKFSQGHIISPSFFPASLGSPVTAAASWLQDPSRQVSVLQLLSDDPAHPLGSDIFIFPLSLQLCPAVGCL